MNATATIALIGLATYALRASMFIATDRWRPQRWMEAPLALVAPAAIAALLGSMELTSNGHASIESIPSLLASIAAFLAARRSGRVLHAFAVGVPVFWALTLATR
jgi:branched-subunit amino acid transport protein